MQNNVKNLVLGLMLVGALVLTGCGGSSGSTGSTGGSGGSGGGGTGGGGTSTPPSTVGDWTWEGGPQNGTYDAGAASTTTWPGSTQPGQGSPAVWVDKTGTVWLFGDVNGDDTDPSNETDIVNGMWKKAPGDTQWTLVAGSINSTPPASNTACETPEQEGVFGTKGVPSTTNIPPSAALGSAFWTDKNGNFWLFGGQICTADTNSVIASNQLWEFNPTNQTWTWVSGDDNDLRTRLNNEPTTIGNPGIYGTKGVGASGNKPGGRYGALGWSDANGNIWIFGGLGTDSGAQANGIYNSGYLNDLWEFNPTTGIWTWISGSSDLSTSTEGSYIPSEGVYGTKGVASPANTPGGRWVSTSWTDSEGNLWLYGGSGIDGEGGVELEESGADAPVGSPGELGDVWKFDTTTNEWTWEGGDSTAETTLVSYGTKGEESATNTPGSRVDSAFCTDASGNLWLYGGNYDASLNSSWPSTNPYGSIGAMSDLWMFDSETGQWKWQGGIQGYGGSAPVYGTENVASTQNSPGGRSQGNCWIDQNGNFWLFGGIGVTTSGPNDIVWDADFDDLWMYQVSQTN